MVARAIARKGTALEKSGDMEGAIAMYNKALTEHRSADVLTKLRACEAGLKKKTEEAYFDVDKATEEKEKGNDHFKAFRVRDRSGDPFGTLHSPHNRSVVCQGASTLASISMQGRLSSRSGVCVVAGMRRWDGRTPRAVLRVNSGQRFNRGFDRGAAIEC